MELALMIAADEARSGSPRSALEWFAAAEGLDGTLPPEYVTKRRRRQLVGTRAAE